MPVLPLLSFLLLQQVPVGQGPERFFIGHTQSRGTVSIALSGSHGVSDRSTGRIEHGNILVIEQQFVEEGKPPRNRIWRLIRSPDNRITGSISDARSPVTGEVRGNVIHLRYQSAEGPGVEQWITLDPNGRQARSHMVFRRLGITLATVDSVSWKVN